MDGESRRAFWAKHIEAFEASGQSRRVYCAAHGLNRNTLDYWRRRLRGGAGSISAKADGASASVFVPVRVMPTVDGAPAALTLHWPCGVKLCLPRDVDPRWLGQVLSGLR